MREIETLVIEELSAVNKKITNLSIDLAIKKDLHEFITGPSKRIRTIFACLFLKASSKTVSKNCLKVITAGEIIHNASLLHDDVIDKAEKRRGNNTIARLYAPEVSVLSGDYLLSAATAILLEIKNNEVLQIFLNCTKKMCQAEIDQFFLRGKMPAIEDYLKICEGKTARLFSAIIESCAILEGLEPVSARNIALDYGILFQLKNDFEEISAQKDAENKIYTAKDILGIEKAVILADNYKMRMYTALEKLPDNIYKKGLEDLITGL